MSQQQDPNADKSAFNVLWGIFGVFALMMLVWYFYSEQLKQLFLIIKTYEAKFSLLFSSSLSGWDKELTDMRHDTSALTLDVTDYVCLQIGKVLRWPVLAILAVLTFLIMAGNAGLRYTKIYDMKRLFLQERKVWPYITPISKVDLVAEDVDEGPWSMARNGVQFCKQHKLIDIELIANPDASWKRDPVAKTSLKKGEAVRLLGKQIGPHWIDIDHVPIHYKALIAVFCARIGRDAKGANAFLAQIAISSESGKLNFSGVDKLLKKHYSNKLVQEVIQSHAFLLTVMASLLLKARDDGVVPVSEFLWLKPLDRTLWYMLNCIGRQVAYVEVAGPFSHWKAERELGRPLRVPMVREAVKGLDEALKEHIYKPDEQEMQELIAKQQGRAG